MKRYLRLWPCWLAFWIAWVIGFTIYDLTQLGRWPEFYAGLIFIQLVTLAIYWYLWRSYRRRRAEQIARAEALHRRYSHAIERGDVRDAALTLTLMAIWEIDPPHPRQ